jgi:N-acetylglucosamine-6-sulfatase
MISEHCADYVAKSFKDRWRTLMSVDDLIDEVVQLVEDLGIADNTYFLYSSDHGFQLGEFNILIDKRQVYDYDTRIHLLVRGPGIKPGSTFKYPGTQVDVTTTWMGMAGLDRPESMDGRSIMPLLVDQDDETVPAATRAHVAKIAPQGSEAYAAQWRDHVYIMYYFNDNNSKCGGYNTEDVHNNFISVRYMPWSEFGDVSYTEYQSGKQHDNDIIFDAVDFVEYFNVSEDKWQMNNLWKTADKDVQAKHSAKLREWFSCRGGNCL